MKLGTNEPKKLLVLGGLVAVAVAVWFINRSEDPSGGRSSTLSPASSTPRPSTPAATRRNEIANAVVEAPRANVSRGGRSSVGVATQEFRPSLKPRNPEDRVDPASIDPTLQLELLARLQTVSLQGGQRSLFDFTSAPPPPSVPGKKTPEPNIPIMPGQPGGNLAGLSPSQPVEPPKLPPPPIPLKFYGFTSPVKIGPKRAFFLDGEDIVVANEGDVIKKRYKVIRIGLSSAVVEDTDVKNQQTLPLVAEMTG